MKKIKTIPARALALALAVCLPPAVPAAAAEPNTPKEEVVYASLENDGAVRSVNVVNIFDLEKAGTVTDYGGYASVRNMTSTDEIVQAGDTVTIRAARAGKLYYQGDLEGGELPWDVSIRWFLDGTEYDAEELAGRSGALKIAAAITRNEKCGGDFFDGYALQVSFTLDTALCRNITAEGASIANVGGDKQLTYTVLPGKGAAFEITADVTDFEMDGAAINGIPLSLDIDVDDEALMEQITELIDAIEALDDGTATLYDGVSELQDSVEGDLSSGTADLYSGAESLRTGAGELQTGGAALQSGAGELDSGTAALVSGVDALSGGVSQMQAALDELNARSAALTGGSDSFQNALAQLRAALDGISVTSRDLSNLRAASAAVLEGVGDIAGGAAALEAGVSADAYKAALRRNGLDIDALRGQNSAAIESLNDIKASLSDETQIAQIDGVISVLSADSAAISGTESYLSSVSGSAGSLAESAAALESSYAGLDGQIEALTGLLGDLAGQMETLTGAVDALAAQYAALDGGIDDYTDGVAQIAAGCAQVTESVKTLTQAADTLRGGARTLYGKTGELLAGIAEIYDGAGTLTNGAGDLDDGAAELLAAIVQLYDGAGELKSGAGEMREKTAGMDAEIDEKIDELIAGVTGGETETASFVSGKNENVQSVQFVLKTDGVRLPEAAQAQADTQETPGFWQKLRSLFTGND